MSRYKIDKQDGAYFMTFTTVGWVDLFIRDTYKQFIADSLNFCVNERGLEIYSYVIMPSHIHLLAGAKENNLSTVVGSFKKFTSRELTKKIQDGGESRREWLLPIFKEAGEKNPRNKKFQIWQQDNHPEEVYSPKFTLSKIKYIHNNPVEEGFVSRPEEYLYSSAKDYSGIKGPVKVSLIELHSLFYT
jgi:REP element-mobilizing transposase RayT